MENSTKTEKAMEMLSLFDAPKLKEKEVIANKLSMSVRQVYRAWDKVKEIRSQNDVNSKKKWKFYSVWLYNLFTDKWFPDPDKKFTKEETKLLGKIEKDLMELEEFKK